MARHRSLRALALAVAGAAGLAGGGPAVAGAAWSPFQRLPSHAADNPADALVSNARGDAVLAFGNEHGGISLMRARAHGRFGRPVALPGDGNTPRVAIDERGIALVAYEYDDGSHDGADFRDGDCCVSLKVSVWRPGRRPTPPRAVRPPGYGPVFGAIAAAGTRRGLLIDGDGNRPVRFAPVRIDGRIGRLRTVAPNTWAPATLGYAGGRAVAGLIRADHEYPARRPTDLGTARQRPAGTFSAPHRFRRTTRPVSFTLGIDEDNGIEMSADGRGGQVAVWETGTGRRAGFVITRKPLLGRERSVSVRRGPASYAYFSRPAVARDGTVVFPWVRIIPGRAKRAVYALVQFPGGAIVNSRLPGRTAVGDDLRAAAAPAGGGAVAITRLPSSPTPTVQVFAVRGGRAHPRQVLSAKGTSPEIGSALLTGNPLDHARAVLGLRTGSVASILR